MKKFTLGLLLSLGIGQSAFGQANYSNLDIPVNDNGTSAFRAPNGTAAYANQRTVMFIHEWEMVPMNLATINSIGFQYKNGTGSTPVVGNFTLYLENTTDISLNKPNSFSAISATMPVAYVGTYTVPGGTGASTITLNLTTPFNYTGDGLYVAWDFQSTGPFATTAATLASNSEQTGWLMMNNSGTAPANTFTLGGYFRPSLVFNAVNTTTNEIEVLQIETPGKVSKLEGTSQNIYVTLVNSSIAAKNNVSVTVNATGANAFNTVTVIPNFPAGAVTTLTFTGYNTPANGQSTITAAAIFPDQNPLNNAQVWTQSVSCEAIGIAESGAPVADYTSYTVGNGVITSFLHETGASTSSLTSVSVVIPSFANAGNQGKQIYAVLSDFSGNIIATGNTLTISGGNMGVVQPLTFATPPALTPNTQYLFGVGTTTSGYFPVGTKMAYGIGGYYVMPLGGGAPQPAPYGFLSLEAALAFPETQLSVVASKTAVCKQDGPGTVTLTASGLDTYTWTPSSLGSGSVVVVTPAVSGATGTAVYNVQGTDQATGCKSKASSVSIIVSACTGLADNTSNGYNIQLFPNPTVNGKAQITGLTGTNLVSVYNTIGQVVLSQNVSEETMNIDLSSYPAGTYMVKITDSSNESRIIKVANSK